METVQERFLVQESPEHMIQLYHIRVATRKVVFTERPIFEQFDYSVTKVARKCKTTLTV